VTRDFFKQVLTVTITLQILPASAEKGEIPFGQKSSVWPPVGSLVPARSEWWM
jgi:hypothetical protein